MSRCKNIGDCKTPGSCFDVFGACLNETVPARRNVTAEEDAWLRRAALRSSKVVHPGKLVEPTAASLSPGQQEDPGK